MLYILVEKEFVNYPWCLKITTGLNAEIRRKRIAVTHLSNMADAVGGKEKSAIILVGATDAWLRHHVVDANKRSLHPIVLSNWSCKAIHVRTSIVSMDIPESIQKALDYLRFCGKSKTALYGVNPSSNSDRWREEVFCEVMHSKAQVYYNDGSLKDTFEDFWQERNRYDSVICTSDYAAISLVKRLQAVEPARLDTLYIVSYGNLFLTSLVSPSITSIADQFEAFGKAAVSIYLQQKNQHEISSISVMLLSVMHIRQTTQNTAYDVRQYELPKAALLQNRFFKEQEINEMAKVEMMLNLCDETDIEILQYLLQDAIYPQIAEKCFVSESTVKYRVKEFGRVCGTESRIELVALLKKYI